MPPITLTAEVSIWVPLQEATELNGCMQFVPSSQKMDVVRHRSINDDPRIHALELHPDEKVRVRDFVSCPLPPGGATFHGPYMLHHTGPNRSQIPRRALILNAGLPPTKRPRPLRFQWMEGKVPAGESLQTLRSIQTELLDLRPRLGTVDVS